MKKVLISLEDILELRANIFRKHFQNCENPDNPTNAAHGVAIFESELCKWFDAQPDASNLNKIINAYEQATDISPEELNIRDEE